MLSGQKRQHRHPRVVRAPIDVFQHPQAGKDRNNQSSANRPRIDGGASGDEDGGKELQRINVPAKIARVESGHRPQAPMKSLQERNKSSAVERIDYEQQA